MSVQHPDPGSARSGSRGYPRSTHTQPSSAGLVRPGWYRDPHRPGQRWWDGTRWTAHTVESAPPPTAVQSNSTTVVSSSTVVAFGHHKSVGAAFVLTFLFGPLGMLYSTVFGAFMMTFVMVCGAVVIGTVTLGVGDLFWIPLSWVICIIWGCVAASGSGTQVVATQATHRHV